MAQRGRLLSSSDVSSRANFACLAMLPGWGPAAPRFDMPKVSARVTIYTGRLKLSAMDLSCSELTRRPLMCPLRSPRSHALGELGTLSSCQSFSP